MIMYVCMVTYLCSKSMDQPDKVVNPANGQLNRENEIGVKTKDLCQKQRVKYMKTIIKSI